MSVQTTCNWLQDKYYSYHSTIFTPHIHQDTFSPFYCSSEGWPFLRPGNFLLGLVSGVRIQQWTYQHSKLFWMKVKSSLFPLLVNWSFQQFQKNLRSTLDRFEHFLADVKNNEGNGTVEGLLAYLSMSLSVRSLTLIGEFAEHELNRFMENSFIQN